MNGLRSSWGWRILAVALAITWGTSGVQAADETGVAGPTEAVPPPTSAQPAIATQPAVPTVALAEEVKPKEAMWVDDALPAGAQAIGTWEWTSAQAYSGTQSHTEPATAGVTEHGFTIGPQALPEGSVIAQYVFLDPQQPPQGLMLKLTLADGSQTSVYWEGDEEVFQIGDEELSWYMDVLPEAGSWQRLEVWVDDFGLGGEQLTSISYVALGGKAFWDKTALEEHPELLLESGEDEPFVDEF